MLKMFPKVASNLRRGNERGLTVRPELVEGRTVKPFMVRQAHHERLNLKLSRLKLVAPKVNVIDAWHSRPAATKSDSVVQKFRPVPATDPLHFDKAV